VLPSAWKPLAEAQAGQQVVDLALVGDHVGAAFGVDHRAVQHAGVDLLALLGRHHLHQQLDQAVLQVVGQAHHLGHHLAGQVVEVLRHHDVGQVLVDAAGARLDVAHEVEDRARWPRPHRVGRQGGGQAAGLRGDLCMLGLGLVDRVQHLLGRGGGLLAM
jgi:hypothetical protein